MQMPRFISIGLVAAVLSTPVMAQIVVADEGSTQAMRSRLAAALTRYGRGVLGTDPMSVEGLLAGTHFLDAATQLNPEDASAWRLLLRSALLVEREDLVAEAIPEIVRLDPGDTTARLQRLWQVLDDAKTLREKSRLADQLLTPEVIKVIGPDVAARLMLRMGLLHRRAGEVDTFMNMLDGALILDPNYRDAMALRAGLLEQLEQSDPVAWTRILVQSHLADLTDAGAAAELGLYLLHHGAYAASARMLSMARALEAASGKDAGAALDADLITAFWASGDFEAAEMLLQEREQLLDEAFQAMSASQSDQRLTPLEVARLKGPLPPKLAMIGVMIAADREDASELTDALATAVEAADDLDLLRLEQDLSESVRIPNFNRLLGLLLVFNGSTGAIEEVESRIQEMEPLDEDKQALVDAALGRMPSSEERVSVLRAQAPQSAVASLVLANLLLENGEKQEAARVLLATWRRSPGTLLGMLARHRLSAILNAPIPMEDPAQSMSDVLASVPAVTDRYPFEPSLAVLMRAEARERRVDVFDPVIVDCTIANHTGMPMAIGPNGPIRDLVLFAPSVDQPYGSGTSGAPILVDIAQRLQIPAHGELEFSLDLRTTWVGDTLNLRPLNGAVVSSLVYFNPRVATAQQSRRPSPRSGPLGSKYEIEPVRVDGQRVTDVWIRSAIDNLRDASAKDDAITMTLLGCVVNDQDATAAPTELSADRESEIVATLIEAWPRLDVVSQRWIATAMPESDRLNGLWSLIKGSTDSIMRQIVLMRIVGRYSSPEKALEEPVVTAGLRSNDDAIRRLAEWIEATLQLRAEQLYGNEGNITPGP